MTTTTTPKPLPPPSRMCALDIRCAATEAGAQIAVVIGGGNFFRGAELQQRGLDRSRSDYMGMLGTVMNCLALQDFLDTLGYDYREETNNPAYKLFLG